MRRAFALLLTALALASPAGAIGQASKTAKAPQSQSPLSQSPLATQSVIQAPIPLASDRNAGDASQCKSSCARGYYFCKAQDDDACSGVWAQCNARCTATYKRGF